jgi:hypothetical protein
MLLYGSPAATGPVPRGSRGEAAMRAVDYVMFHTNGQLPEEVHAREVAVL